MNNRKSDIPRLILIKDDCFYEIQWKNDLGKERGRPVVGQAADTGQITLKRGEPIADTYETLAHEILHCIEYEYGIKIPHNLIYKMQEGLGFILRHNFCWIKWSEPSDE